MNDVLFAIVLIVNGEVMKDTPKNFTSRYECNRYAHMIVTDPHPFEPNRVIFYSPNQNSRAYCVIQEHD